MKMITLFTFTIHLTLASVLQPDDAMKIHRALPEIVGTLGHGRVALIGKNLFPTTEVWATAPSMDDIALNVHRHSSDPRGTQIAFELPPLPEDARLELRSGDNVVRVDTSKFQIRNDRVPRATVHTAKRLTAVAGDTIHVLMDETTKLHEVHGVLYDVSGKHPTQLRPESHRHEPEATHRDEVHLGVPAGVEAGQYNLTIFHDTAGAVDMEHGDVSLLVLPSVKDVRYQVGGSSNELEIEGSGFSLQNTEVMVHGQPCQVVSVDFHLLSVKCSEIKEGASALREQTDRGFPLHLESEAQEDEVVVLHDSFVFPVPHPQHPTGFRFDTFTATGEALFRAPKEGTYVFDLDCSGMQCWMRIGEEEISHEGVVSVAMGEDEDIEVVISFKHTQHSQQLKLRVTLPDGTVLDSVPADWFIHAAMLDTPVTVRVNGLEAICRDKKRVQRCHPRATHVDVDVAHVEPMPVINVGDLLAKGVTRTSRRRLAVPSGAELWSSWGPVNCRSSNDDCLIPQGTTIFLDESVTVRVLTIRGTLIWDTDTDNIVLRAASVIVASNGRFELDQTAAGRRTKATIYIRNDVFPRPEHDIIGNRVFGMVHDGGNNDVPPVLKIKGRPLGRTWALLTQPVQPGGRTLTLDKTAAETGWLVGDRIVVANTGMTHIKSEIQPEVFTIEALSGNQVTLNTGVRQLHFGHPNENLQAEVINLSRDVTITGDDFDSSKQGLHTIAAIAGTVQIEYTRVEKCGQRGDLGRYCMHFHVMSDKCVDCHFKGNAIEHSQQRGIVIHGSHQTLVQENVMYEVRGAYLYVEDGNEMENVMQENVMICHNKRECRIGGTDNQFADHDHQSGIWALSTTNDLIGNRAVNHENGCFLQTSAFSAGKGAAAGQVCTVHAPFGKIQGNVFHSCNRFGFYPDNNQPRNLDRDIASNGMVRDRDSCDLFTKDGKDNGVFAMVEDGLDWGHAFVGQYHLTDVQYVRHTSFNSVNNMYWKTTKNFADGKTTAHIIDSTYGCDVNLVPGMRDLGFVNSAALFLGPGGHGVFTIQDTRFFGYTGRGAVVANQHCDTGGFAGSLCTPQYELVNVDFSDVDDGEKWIEFGASGGDPTLPIFNSQDGSLGQWQSSVSKAQAHLLRLPGNVCRLASSEGVQDRFGDNIVCTQPTRRLNIWSVHQDITITAPGGGRQTLKWFAPEGHKTKRQGMGANIVMPPPGTALSDWQYSFNLDWNAGRGTSGPSVTIEFADQIYQELYGLDYEIELEINGEVCRAASFDDRSWISLDGPFQEGYGSCVGLSGKTPFIPSPDTPSEPSSGSPSGTPSGQFNPGHPTDYQGCFSVPDIEFRDVHHVITPDLCAAECTGSKYSVLTFHFKCGCTDVEPRGQLDDGECNTSCEGDRSINCGGVNAASYYTRQGEESSAGTPSGSPAASNPERDGCSMDAWNDVERECGECAALVTLKDRTCEAYCAHQGLGCANAWDDEEEETCSLSATRRGCQFFFAGTSDAICECEPLGTTLARSSGSLSGDGESSGSPSETEVCTPSTWSDLDLECSGCAALVTLNGRTCQSYCSDQGLGCADAWDDEEEETCSPLATRRGCQFSFLGTSDAICQCAAPGNTGSPSETENPGSSSGTTEVCTPSTWNDVDATCSGCAALVTLNGRTCDAYCSDQGLECSDSWDDEQEETCSPFAERRGCHFSFPGTSDAICECAAPSGATAPRPARTLRPAPGGSVCGIATSLNACTSTQQEVGVNMECFAYGGPNDLCSLNNNNDENHGLDKDPSACRGEHLFLWDEPDTQGESYAWAGRTWVQYCQRWSGELSEFKARGGRVVGPAVKNDKYVDNMNQFFDACGSSCVEEGPCKIDAAAANVFTGPWNNGDYRGAVRWSMDQFAKVSTKLPVLITNWSNLGGQTPDDQLPTMQVTDEFFAADAPVQIDRVYYFLARDFGGGSENNLATSVTSDGRTLGERWRETCSDLDRTVQVRPQTGLSRNVDRPGRSFNTARPLLVARSRARTQTLLKSSMEESADLNEKRSDSEDESTGSLLLSFDSEDDESTASLLLPIVATAVGVCLLSAICAYLYHCWTKSPDATLEIENEAPRGVEV